MLKMLLKSLLLPHLRHNKPPRRLMQFLLRLSQTTAGTQAAPKRKVTPKQDELNKNINIENEILASLYRKRNLGQASESDRKEILTTQATLKRLKRVERSGSKRYSTEKEVVRNATRQKKKWFKTLLDRKSYAMKGNVNSRVWTKRHVKS